MKLHCYGTVWPLHLFTMENTSQSDITITVIQLNVNGLRPRKEELEFYLSHIENAIVLLNDTRLNDKTTDVTIPGFNMYCQNKSTNDSYAGGVAILVPTTWMVHDPQTFDDVLIEAKAMVIFPPQCDPIKVATIYNHPGQNVPELFFTRFSDLKYNGKALKGIVMSDFNSPHENFGSRYTNSAGRNLMNLIEKFDLILLNDESPTYYSFANTKPNILDLALCDMGTIGIVDSFYIGSDIGSDHLPVHVDLVIQNRSKRASSKIEIKTTDWSRFQCILLESLQQLPHIQEHPSKEEFDHFFEFMSTLILEAKSRSTFIRKSFGLRKKEFSRQTTDWIKTRRYLSDKKKSSLLTDREKQIYCHLYNKANKIVKKLVKEESEKDLESFATRLSEEQNSAKKWKMVKEFHGNGSQKRTKYPLLKPDGTYATTDQERADLFASRLESVHQTANHPLFDDSFKNDTSQFVNQNHHLFKKQSRIQPEPGDDDDSVMEVPVSEFKDALIMVKKKSSTGIDNIHLSSESSRWNHRSSLPSLNQMSSPWLFSRPVEESKGHSHTQTRKITL
jgi:hypothetical protein